MAVNKFYAFLHVKVVGPVRSQITQGATREKISMSLAAGAVLGVTPLLGTTSALCVLFGFLFKLNHVSLQAANYLVYPLQLALLIPLFRFGEWLFGVEPVAMDISSILRQFEQDFSQALRMWGMTGLRGFAAWAICAPAAYLMLYFILYSLLRKRVKAPPPS